MKIDAFSLNVDAFSLDVDVFSLVIDAFFINFLRKCEGIGLGWKTAPYSLTAGGRRRTADGRVWSQGRVARCGSQCPQGCGSQQSCSLCRDRRKLRAGTRKIRLARVVGGQTGEKLKINSIKFKENFGRTRYHDYHFWGKSVILNGIRLETQ